MAVSGIPEGYGGLNLQPVDPYGEWLKQDLARRDMEMKEQEYQRKQMEELTKDLPSNTGGELFQGSIANWSKGNMMGRIKGAYLEGGEAAVILEKDDIQKSYDEYGKLSTSYATFRDNISKPEFATIENTYKIKRAENIAANYAVRGGVLMDGRTGLYLDPSKIEELEAEYPEMAEFIEDRDGTPYILAKNFIPTQDQLTSTSSPEVALKEVVGRIKQYKGGSSSVSAAGDDAKSAGYEGQQTTTQSLKTNIDQFDADLWGTFLNVKFSQEALADGVVTPNEVKEAAGITAQSPEYELMSPGVSDAEALAEVIQWGSAGLKAPGIGYYEQSLKQYYGDRPYSKLSQAEQWEVAARVYNENREKGLPQLPKDTRITQTTGVNVENSSGGGLSFTFGGAAVQSPTGYTMSKYTQDVKPPTGPRTVDDWDTKIVYNYQGGNANEPKITLSFKDIGGDSKDTQTEQVTITETFSQDGQVYGVANAPALVEKIRMYKGEGFSLEDDYNIMKGRVVFKINEDNISKIEAGYHPVNTETGRRVGLMEAHGLSSPEFDLFLEEENLN